MVKFVIVKKNGCLVEKDEKIQTIQDICKKSGFRSMNHFDIHYTYEVDKTKHIKVYGKKKGNAGMENKYEMPPPLDNILFFGTISLLGYNPKKSCFIDMDEEEWKKIYELLYGGFEDIVENDSDDESEECELENIHPSKLTKNGYLKDGFVVEDECNVDTNSENSNNVSDSSESEESYSDELTEEEYIGESDSD